MLNLLDALLGLLACLLGLLASLLDGLTGTLAGLLGCLSNIYLFLFARSHVYYSLSCTFACSFRY
jgi:hypothetical protein